MSQVLFDLIGAYATMAHTEGAEEIMEEAMARTNALPARINDFFFQLGGGSASYIYVPPETYTLKNGTQEKSICRHSSQAKSFFCPFAVIDAIDRSHSFFMEI